jgi:hypothetical protein
MVRVKESENEFEAVKEAAERIKMQINGEKTQLLCVSYPGVRLVRSEATINGSKIQSSETLKIVGFVFNNRPDASAHIAHTEKRFYDLVWVLKNLREARWGSDNIVKIYKTAVRPVLEYCSNAYQSMLTQCEARRLEALQKVALRVVYGWQYSYESLLQMSGVSELSVRRIEKLDRFLLKTEKNPRFANKWLVKNENRQSGRRSNKYILPKYARATTYKNPVSYFASRLNYLHRST